MFHGTLALLSRALKLDARHRAGHFIRLGSVLLIFVFLITAHVTSAGVGAPGLRFFLLISWLNLALICLSAASYFATAVTEEKEEGTLGLLQLAGISPLGLLLGKGTSRLISALMLFLGQLPFALLSISLGGITAHQILATYVALGAFLAFTANVALLCSVVFRRSGSACVWMMLFLGLWLGGVPAVNYSLSVLTVAGYLPKSHPVLGVIERLLAVVDRHSIVTRIHTILETGFDGSLVSTQVILNLTGAAVAFGLSWLVFDRFARYADVSTPARGWLPRLTLRYTPLIDRPWNNAIVWKDYHFITGGHAMALLKLVAYPSLLALMWYGDDWVDKVTGLSFLHSARWLMVCIIAGELMIYASRVFHEEVKWGTLPNLALLPCSVTWICLSKVAGCLLALLPALATLMGLYALFPDRVRPLTEVFSEPVAWMLLMQFAVLLHLAAFCSLWVKWGAPALAVAILLIVDVLMLPVVSTLTLALSASYQDEAVAIGPIIYTGTVACVVLQCLIALQFRHAAAR